MSNENGNGNGAVGSDAILLVWLAMLAAAVCGSSGEWDLSMAIRDRADGYSEMEKSAMKDGKFKIENNQIIKITNGEPIPDDEPIIIVRARDWLAIPLLDFYLELTAKDECTDYHLDGIRERLEAFRKFAEEHPHRMKQPGITRGK